MRVSRRQLFLAGTLGMAAAGNARAAQPPDEGWLAFVHEFLGCTIGALPPLDVPDVAIFADGRIVWRGHGGWCEAQLHPALLARLRVRGDRTRFLAGRPTRYADMLATGASLFTQVGYRQGERSRNPAILELHWSARDPGADEFVRSAAEMRDLIRSLIPTVETPWQGEEIQVAYAPRPRSGEALPWPLDEPLSPTNSGGRRRFRGAEARQVLEVLQRNSIVSVDGVKFGTHWAPVLAVPHSHVDLGRERAVFPRSIPPTGVQALAGLDGPVASLDWDMAGKRLAAGASAGKHTLCAWDVRSGKRLLQVSQRPVACVRWRPRAGALTEDLGGSEESIIGGHLAVMAWGAIAWSPNGRSIAQVEVDSGLGAYTTDGKTLWETRAGRAGSGLAWHPDGTRLAVSSSTGQVAIRNAATGVLVRTLGGADADSDYGVAHPVAWRPGSRQIAIPGYTDGTIRVYETGSGAEVARLSGRGSTSRDLSWSPDGNRLAAVDFAEVVIWDLRTRQRVRILKTSAPASAVAWSPDGTRIATGAENGDVWVWPLAAAEKEEDRGRK